MTEFKPAAAVLAPRIIGDEGYLVASALAFVRSHLDMEIAYLSEFVEDNLVFRAVNAPGFEEIAHVGAKIPLSTTYCRHILEGRLPELIPDTSDLPFAQSIPLTHELPIRAHVSIPIHRTDGSVYGMFCCLNRESHPGLNERDLGVMKAFAALSADQVNMQLERDNSKNAKRYAIERVLETGGFQIALQPIMRLQDHGTAGYEALCRFAVEPYRPPNLWHR